jgi:hypothetical protein
MVDIRDIGEVAAGELLRREKPVFHCRARPTRWSVPTGDETATFATDGLGIRL